MKKWILAFTTFGCATVALVFATSATDDCKCRGTKEKCCDQCPSGNK